MKRLLFSVLSPCDPNFFELEKNRRVKPGQFIKTSLRDLVPIISVGYECPKISTFIQLNPWIH